MIAKSQPSAAAPRTIDDLANLLIDGFEDDEVEDLATLLEKVEVTTIQ